MTISCSEDDAASTKSITLETSPNVHTRAYSTEFVQGYFEFNMFTLRELSLRLLYQTHSTASIISACHLNSRLKLAFYLWKLWML